MQDTNSATHAESFHLPRSPAESPDPNDPNCKVCNGDRPFRCVVPGLDGMKCECGIWVGTCRDCIKWVPRMNRKGICPPCQVLRDLAEAEKKRKRSRRAKKTTTKKEQTNA